MQQLTNFGSDGAIASPTSVIIGSSFSKGCFF
jgi:hypothetical protein